MSYLLLLGISFLGLYGQSSLEQARIDVVMEIIHDLQLTFSIGQVQKDAKNKVWHITRVGFEPTNLMGKNQKDKFNIY